MAWRSSFLPIAATVEFAAVEWDEDGGPGHRDPLAEPGATLTIETEISGGALDELSFLAGRRQRSASTQYGAPNRGGRARSSVHLRRTSPATFAVGRVAGSDTRKKDRDRVNLFGLACVRRTSLREEVLLARFHRNDAHALARAAFIRRRCFVQLGRMRARDRGSKRSRAPGHGSSHHRTAWRRLRWEPSGAGVWHLLTTLVRD